MKKENEIPDELNDLTERLAKAEAELAVWQVEKQIADTKKQMKRFHPPTTTKIIMLFLFLNCTAVEIYSMVAMWKLYDLSALYSLISAVIGETISFAVYAAKAYNETKQEQLIKLERDKLSFTEEESDETADPDFYWDADSQINESEEEEYG